MSSLSTPAVLTPPASWGVGEQVSSSTFVDLDDDQLLTELRTIETVSAWLAARGVAVVEELSRRREDSALERLDPDASGRECTLARIGARESVIDEIALATGVGQRAATTRVQLARHDAERHAPIREALAAGAMSWSRAVQVLVRADAVDSHAVPRIVAEVLAPWNTHPDSGDDGGLDVPQTVFSWRLGRAVAAATTSAARHEHAVENRDAWATITPDADGCLSATGDAARIAGAFNRVEGIARRLRRQGDARTLAQLRSDVTLDLLQHGQLPLATADEPGEAFAAYDTFGGRLPAARVDVTISAASLLGLDGQPGTIVVGGREEHLAAHALRRVAHAEGSVWRRLVTDPATGYMADLSTTRYAITGELRERVIARDRHSRVPGSMRPAQWCDTDHDVDFHRGGSSSESNVSAKNRRGHNHKTQGRWTSAREPGVHGAITWTTPAGRTYRTTPHDYRDKATRWRMIRTLARTSGVGDPPDTGKGSAPGRATSRSRWREPGPPPF